MPATCPKRGAISDQHALRSLRNVLAIGFNSLWYVFRFASVAPFVLALRGAYSRRRRRRKCGVNYNGPWREFADMDDCARCGYSLIGNAPGRCPECGWRLPRPYVAQRRLADKKLCRKDNGAVDSGAT